MYTVHEYPGSLEAYTGHFRRYMDPDFHPAAFRGVMAYDDLQIIRVERPGPTINLGLVDFTPNRWANFVAHYIHRDSFLYFLSKLPTLNPGQQVGYTTPIVAPHSLGNCLMGFTASKRGKGKAILRMVSRTSIWAPTGALDMYLGSLVAWWWGKQISENVEFHWELHQVQMTTWKSLPFMINLAYMDALEDLRRTNPTAQPNDLTRADLVRSPLIQALLDTTPTKNRFLKQMRTVYATSRDVNKLIGGTYRLPLRQTNRMLAAEKRFLQGAQRRLRPPMPYDPFKAGTEIKGPPVTEATTRMLKKKEAVV